jgi:hypothetical protein
MTLLVIARGVGVLRFPPPPRIRRYHVASLAHVCAVPLLSLALPPIYMLELLRGGSTLQASTLMSYSNCLATNS